MRTFCIVLSFLILPHASFAKKEGLSTTPTLSVAPLITLAPYGYFLGAAITVGAIVDNRHKITVGAHAAPIGASGVTDVATSGKMQYWGSTLNYQYQISFCQNLLKVSPGVAFGISSIPYFYGTLHPADSSIPDIQHLPSRETVPGCGPMAELSLGGKNISFVATITTLVAIPDHTTVLTTFGISYTL